MNIFVLDKDPFMAAQAHYDKHVVKMLLESAQMLCTVANSLGFKTPYKPTHRNHPCTKWVGESKQNFDWLLDLAIFLNAEWKLRYNHPKDKNHKSMQVLFYGFGWDKVRKKLPDIGLTPFAQAMPEEFQGPDAVEAYRKYYMKDKAHLKAYTNREEPEWMKEQTNV